MCFEAEFPSTLLGAPRSADVPSQFFRGAPQAALFPDAHADPSPAAVSAFLEQHGIDHIYVDAGHPNTLVPGATHIVSDGGASVLSLR